MAQFEKFDGIAFLVGQLLRKNAKKVKLDLKT